MTYAEIYKMLVENREFAELMKLACDSSSEAIKEATEFLLQSKTEE